MIKRFKEKGKRKTHQGEPLRISFSFAITQTLDLAEEQPLSHGIKLTFITMNVAREIINDEDLLLAIFYSSIFHDAGMTVIRKELFRKLPDFYKNWELHKSEGFSSFKDRLEATLNYEQLEIWKRILADSIETIIKMLNIYGIKDEVLYLIKNFLYARYGGKRESAFIFSLITLSEKVFHLFGGNKKNREKAISFLSSEYQNYDYEIVSTLLKFLSDDDFIEFLFEGEIEEEIIRLKPPETRDYILDSDDIKDLFSFMEEIWFDTGVPHTKRVEKLLRGFAKDFYLSPDDIEKLSLIAGVHDIGRLHIPPEILYRKKKLTRAQIRVIQRHPYYSEMIMRKIPGMEEIADIVGKHHEYLDCSGYWRGVCGDAINFYTRLLTIADIYGALTSPRPYRKAFSSKKAISIMEKEFAGKLDKEIFEHFKKFILSQ